MKAEKNVPAVDYWDQHVFNAVRREGSWNLVTKKITECELRLKFSHLQVVCSTSVVLVSSLTTRERGNYCHPSEVESKLCRPFLLTYYRLQESVPYGKW